MDEASRISFAAQQRGLSMGGGRVSLDSAVPWGKGGSRPSPSTASFTLRTVPGSELVLSDVDEPLSPSIGNTKTYPPSPGTAHPSILKATATSRMAPLGVNRVAPDTTGKGNPRSPLGFSCHENPVANWEDAEASGPGVGLAVEGHEDTEARLRFPDPRVPSAAVAPVASDASPLPHSAVQGGGGGQGAEGRLLQGRPTPSPFDLQLEEADFEDHGGQGAADGPSPEPVRRNVERPAGPLGEGTGVRLEEEEEEGDRQKMKTEGCSAPWPPPGPPSVPWNPAAGHLQHSIHTLREWCIWHRLLREHCPSAPTAPRRGGNMGHARGRLQRGHFGAAPEGSGARSKAVAESTLDDLVEELEEPRGSQPAAAPHHQSNAARRSMERVSQWSVNTQNPHPPLAPHPRQVAELLNHEMDEDGEVGTVPEYLERSVRRSSGASVPQTAGLPATTRTSAMEASGDAVGVRASPVVGGGGAAGGALLLDDLAQELEADIRLLKEADNERVPREAEAAATSQPLSLSGASMDPAKSADGREGWQHQPRPPLLPAPSGPPHKYPGSFRGSKRNVEVHPDEGLQDLSINAGGIGRIEISPHPLLAVEKPSALRESALLSCNHEDPPDTSKVDRQPSTESVSSSNPGSPTRPPRQKGALRRINFRTPSDDSAETIHSAAGAGRSSSKGVVDSDEEESGLKAVGLRSPSSTTAKKGGWGTVKHVVAQKFPPSRLGSGLSDASAATDATEGENFLRQQSSGVESRCVAVGGGGGSIRSKWWVIVIL